MSLGTSGASIYVQCSYRFLCWSMNGYGVCMAMTCHWLINSSVVAIFSSSASLHVHI